MNQEFVHLYKSKRVSFKKREVSTKWITIFINDAHVLPCIPVTFLHSNLPFLYLKASFVAVDEVEDYRAGVGNLQPTGFDHIVVFD